ncbi:unnamed protein product [Rotaria socialis]|uniref:Uncharacterized protein n=2 Tax=Rotaria socialis TaxID=392032 RepID=A0A818BNW6_9BILA|nr:unnamed protein product [Rotaria socialis]
MGIRRKLAESLVLDSDRKLLDVGKCLNDQDPVGTLKIRHFPTTYCPNPIQDSDVFPSDPMGDVTIPIRYWILGVSIRIVTSLLKSLLSNNDQLLEISKSQEDESLSYYNEDTRILILYNELVTKYNQLEIDYKSIQSLLQQKNETYLQCQNELNTYQNLLYHQKKKSDDILECTYFLSTQKCILSPNLLSIQ